ncbi:hypothetical protein OSSY52_07330 [Tepiditoga spiralis]|uniref:Uncharacterized protein n=1 Tax=Tepiditoga spiralis TaxID=2108365 RepID=A0A7G1G943_9BACT|nr:hypothetical protein OSSY52_07330 [Tepiditoga spiralis]
MASFKFICFNTNKIIELKNIDFHKGIFLKDKNIIKIIINKDSIISPIFLK